MAEMTIGEALRKAMVDEMRLDENVFCLGQDIGIDKGWGGAFGINQGMVEEFGHERIIDTPIAEYLMGGLCIGSALAGMRPICDVQYGDFLFNMASPIFNEAPKISYMSGGKMGVPMVLRMPVGSTGRGGQHAQSLEGFLVHTNGLKVICPSDAYDAKGLMTAAIRDDNPVVVLEHKLLYGNKGVRVEKNAVSTVCDVPDGDYVVPIGKGRIRREGTHITVVANLLMVYRVLEAANVLAEEGIEVELIDPRSLLPFDHELVYESVRKTHRLVIVHEDTLTNGWGAEVAARAAENCLYDLDAPVKRVTVPDTILPCAKNLESFLVPSVERIVQEIRSIVNL
jgi:pyruvate dehydrogenase E1 component beta subunit